MDENISFHGAPTNCETERKYLIEYPDKDKLDNTPECRRYEIIQTYLNSDSDNEIRVRQRSEDGKSIYYKTVKKTIDGLKRMESEICISEEEYHTLLKDSDTSRNQIRKTRYCLMYKSKCFEIDIYPFWHDKAIMEIELSDENEEIIFPDFIKVIREVTYDNNYKNSSLAINIPDD